LLLHIS
jgi:hypothetical protein